MAALLAGAALPCRAVEREGAPVCAPEGVLPDGAHPDDEPGDGCAGCLVCCASYVEPAAPRILTPAPARWQPLLRVDRDPPGSPLPVWRPPRR